MKGGVRLELTMTKNAAFNQFWDWLSRDFLIWGILLIIYTAVNIPYVHVFCIVEWYFHGFTYPHVYC